VGRSKVELLMFMHSVVDEIIISIVIIIIHLLRIAVTKATGCVSQEKIRIHNYVKIQHMLKY